MSANPPKINPYMPAPTNPAIQPQKKTLQVTSISELQSVDPNRLGKRDARVTYRAGPFESYQFTIPAEDLTEPKVKAAMLQDYNRRPHLHGLSVEV